LKLAQVRVRINTWDVRELSTALNDGRIANAFGGRG
jgi:hypothetical protein